MYQPLGFTPAELLLPAPQVPLGTWACLACDQHTSEPEFWEAAALAVGSAPSCLKLVLPECWLPETAQRVPAIHREMTRCLENGDLLPQPSCFVLVERTTPSGSRLGLVGAADLEQYDYTGRKSLIRPTEETITSRLPARQAIRREAPLETSHVLLLLDDPLRTVIEPLYARREELPCLYDFEVMQGCGHLKGWRISEEEDLRAIADALARLKDRQGEDPLLFAVGDGNHSLATAKAHWEALKPTLSPEAQRTHPARYAMVEVENIHDAALNFEPIHRILTHVDGEELLADWTAFCRARGMTLADGAEPEAHVFTVLRGGTRRTCSVRQPDGPLPAATLQRFLDDYLRRHPDAEIDYIHGDDVLARLSEAPGAMGFLLPPLDKSAFFGAIGTLGTLPRKTFSMGHANEKRCYMECRAIR